MAIRAVVSNFLVFMACILDVSGENNKNYINGQEVF
jgi:hypothetical protein